MNDKMTPDKERENCPCRKAIINPFDAMMMVVVRRLDKAYLELKRSKPPAKEAEFALRNAKLSFYGELVRQSIETVFSPEEIIALYGEIRVNLWGNPECLHNRSEQTIYGQECPKRYTR